MTHETVEKRSGTTWRESLPAAWSTNRESSLVHHACYQALGARTGPVSLGEFQGVVNAFSAVAIAHRALKVSCPVGGPVPAEDENGHVRLLLQIQELSLAAGVYLHFFSLEERAGAGREAKDRISAAVGLATAILGPNATYHLWYESVINLATNEESFDGKVFRNPVTWPRPRIGQADRGVLHAALEALDALSLPERRRITLSLRWYKQGVGGEEDGVLKLWLALEALTMTGTNIRGLRKAVAAAYGEPEEKVSERYLLGRLHGLRSDIVHGKIRGSSHAHIVDFMAGLYTDLLSARLGCPVRQDGKQLRERLGKELDDALAMAGRND